MNYIYGKRNGTNKTYFCTGGLMHELNYVDDKLHGMCIFYDFLYKKKQVK